ncbi:MAG TPA: MFS transporter, partial [Ktedonobacterales bacterium]|nr:MFS transporter [Ktedonobacterales bacterium]
ANVNENLSVEQPEGQSGQQLSLPDAAQQSARRLLPGHVFSRFVAAGPWKALSYSDYRLLWSGQLISTAGSQMRIVAVAWQVYLLSGSALELGLLGLLQAIPTMIFSLMSGVIADAFDRRKLLLFTQVSLALCSTALALLTAFNLITVPLIYLIAFVSAAVAAFDFPTRQALIAKIVPGEQLTNAYSLNSLTFSLATVIGPTLGGFTIAWVGVAGAYWCDVSSFLCVIVAIILMQVDGRPGEGRTRPGLQSMVDGFGFLRRHPVLLAVMMLDFCAMLFGATRGLLPIYARNIYNVGPQGLGILQASAPVGAVLATLFSGPIARIRRQGLGVVLSIAAYGGFVVLFGFSSWSFALGLFFLAASGAADTISTVLRSTIVQLGTPDDFRGRVSSVYAIFAIGGPMLGQFESGAFADFATAPIAMVGGGLLVILCAGLSSALVPAIRRFRPIQEYPSP